MICRYGLQCTYKNGNYLRCGRRRGEEPYRQYRTEWIVAENLDIGDFVVYPKANEKEVDIEKIRILDYIDDFLNITGDSYDDDSKQTDLFGGFIDKTIAMNENPTRDHFKTPAEFYLNENIMRIFGYFIAEGNVDIGEFDFSFNINEKEYIEDVEKVMKNTLGLFPEHRYVEGVNTHILRYHNKILSNMFQNMFCPKEYVTKKGKGSKANILLNSKMLSVRIPPEFLNLPLSKLAQLITGIYRGDGRKKDKYYDIKTTSDTLAHQLVYILSKFGIIPSLNILNYKKHSERWSNQFVIGIYGKDIEIFDKIVGEICEFREDTRERTMHYLKGRNLYYVPIEEVDIIKYHGDVWNLEVEEDNSYVSPIVVHNCMPTIGTNWSGQLEFMNNENSFLINIDGTATESRCNWICSEYVGGKFAVPNKNHLRQLMRYIYEHREYAKEKGTIAREYIVNNFSWDISCNRIYERLKNIKYHKNL